MVHGKLSFLLPLTFGVSLFVAACGPAATHGPDRGATGPSRAADHRGGRSADNRRRGRSQTDDRSSRGTDNGPRASRQCCWQAG